MSNPTPPIINLPSIYAITAAELAPSVTAFIDELETSIAKHNLQLIQVRDKNLSATERKQLAAACVSCAKKYDARVLINDDEELAKSVKADGVHLSAKRLTSPGLRYNWSLVAASTHNLTEAQQALQLPQLDFIVLSPLKPTHSHPTTPSLGWEGFAKICSQLVPLPVYALGGLNADDLPVAVANGARGIAAIRSIWSLLTTDN